MMSKCIYCGAEDIELEDGLDPVFGACHNVLDCNDRRGYVSDPAFLTGAAIGFGIVGMALAIKENQEYREWLEWEAAVDARQNEIEERQERAMREERRLSRYDRE